MWDLESKSSSPRTFKIKEARVNVNIIAIYVHELTTVITFEYFDAILNECIGNTLKFM